MATSTTTVSPPATATDTASPDRKRRVDIAHIEELCDSFKAGLGLHQEDDMQREFRKDTPKGGD